MLRARDKTTNSIYQIEIGWYLLSAPESFQILDMLVIAENLDEAGIKLRKELTDNWKKYEVNKKNPIIIYGGKKLGYFMYPKLIK